MGGSMAFKKYSHKEQVKGMFDNGNIKENKPIGFQQDGGDLLPYSNLFYWANAWTDEGGLIGEHSHRGFEILSFVLYGKIEHFDSEHKEWQSLNKGDVQIIRSGKGISHAEKFEKHSRIFQIWFDPDLKKTWFKSPSYSNYHCSEFPHQLLSDKEIVTIKGKNSPLAMETDGIEILKISYQTGMHELDFSIDNIYSIYVMSGKLNVDESLSLKADDFLVVENESMTKFLIHEKTELFIVASPARLQYRTFAELFD